MTKRSKRVEKPSKSVEFIIGDDGWVLEIRENGDRVDAQFFDSGEYVGTLDFATRGHALEWARRRMRAQRTVIEIVTADA